MARGNVFGKSLGSTSGVTTKGNAFGATTASKKTGATQKGIFDGGLEPLFQFLQFLPVIGQIGQQIGDALDLPHDLFGLDAAFGIERPPEPRAPQAPRTREALSLEQLHANAVSALGEDGTPGSERRGGTDSSALGLKNAFTYFRSLVEGKPGDAVNIFAALDIDPLKLDPEEVQPAVAEAINLLIQEARALSFGDEELAQSIFRARLNAATDVSPNEAVPTISREQILADAGFPGGFASVAPLDVTGEDPSSPDFFIDPSLLGNDPFFF